MIVFILIQKQNKKKKRILKKIYIGEYKSDIEERETEKDGNITIYHPPGVEEEIRVDMSQSYKYKISVKDLDNQYYYKDKN